MKKVLIQLIRWYQALPIRTHLYCRFQPTCSQYMIDAINEYGCTRGTWMGIKRIIRCNPFSKPGYDPVIRRQI